MSSGGLSGRAAESPGMADIPDCIVLERHRELESPCLFDLTLRVVLGDAVQQGLAQDDCSITGAFLA
jgi:hypothetical protein